MHTVFVYGSLKRGKRLNHVLSTSEFLGEAISKGPYLLVNLNGWFPGAIKDKAFSVLKGELYKITDNVLGTLDMIESNGQFYTRNLRNFIKDGDEIEAWIYELPPENRYEALPPAPLNLQHNYYYWE